MALGLSTTVRNAMMQAILTALDLGSGAGKIRIYSGTRPATGGTPTTLLAELALTDPAASAPSGGVLTLSAISDDASADATGTATWFRMLDSDNTFVLDGSVTGTGGGGDMELDSTSLVAGGVVSVTSAVFTAPNA